MSDDSDDEPILKQAARKKAEAPKKRPPAKKDDGKPPAKKAKTSASPKAKPKASPKPKAKPAAKKPAAKKAKKEEEDDDDDDDDDDDEEEEDDDFEEDEGPKRKKPKAKPKAKAQPKAKPAAKKPASGGAKAKAKAAPADSRKPRELKAMGAIERLEMAMKSYKWWEDELPAGINWRRLEHNGVFFPPAYEPHGVQMLYDGEPVELTAEQEEVATFYALVPDDGPQLGDPKTRPIFQKNFFHDFKALLGKEHAIRKFEKCDFGPIVDHVEREKQIRKSVSDEEKLQRKAEKEEGLLNHGFALYDDHLEKLGNYNMEPPSLFRGRGVHPLMGKLKQRAIPEQLAINLSEDSAAPMALLPGHGWGSVSHDPTVTWLSAWHENIMNSNKYVMLSAGSSTKGKSDRSKYGKAMRLKACIEKIRKDYRANLNHQEPMVRQIGVAMWLIDILALRVGGEKGDDEADTVGCCSLRVEHLSFDEAEDSFEMGLEFLGKDSMLFKDTIDFAKHGDVGKKVHSRLQSFIKKKKPSDQVFTDLTPPILNKHLQTLMKGLSAKVFRTYNASETLEKQLPTPESLKNQSVAQKYLAYNEANRIVAILCNHQRTVSKAAQQGLEATRGKVDMMKQQKKELQEMAKAVKSGKKVKCRSGEDLTERAAEQKEAAQKMVNAAKTKEEKLASTAAAQAAQELKRQAAKEKSEQSHLWDKPPTLEQVEKRVEQWSEKIRKAEIDLRNKDENKEVSLGTSKINYCDPRITVAWCKRCEVPIEKIFPKALRDKFNWAMAVPPDWSFVPANADGGGDDDDDDE